LRLASAQISTFSGKLAAPIPSGTCPLTDRAGALLTLHDDAGHWGQGEASPLPGYSRDSLEATLDGLNAVPWSGIRLELHATPLAEAARVSALLGSNLVAARFAVETAVLDLLGRAAARSVPSLLGVKADAAVPLCHLLVAITVDEQRGEADRAFRSGIRAFKRKLRGPSSLDQDMGLAEALRSAFGNRVSLRLDANGAFAPEAAAAMLERVRKVGPELVEEPSSAALETRIGEVPLALDESLQECPQPEQLPAFLKQRRASVVVLKPMALGGFARCAEVARAAAGVGVACLVTHLFDGPVGMTATAALALSLPGRCLPCGLTPHAALRVWPETGLPYLRGGEAHAWNLHGLGFADEVCA
jgi:L-alanine-DL-glutamate epimerase-like enolase superfamily enzyme